MTARRPPPGRQRVVCIIPALDAAETIGAVVDGLRRSVPGAMIVGIDDGSRDRTRARMSGLCDRAIGFDENRGKGAALRAGIDEALALDAGQIVAIDADGQHDPARAPALLATLAHADLAIGARARVASSMPWPRRVTNALSAAATRRLTGCEIPDPQSGYRAMRVEVARAVRATGDRYEFETDFLLRAVRAGFRVASVPIETRYGAPSHFREVRDGCRVIATFWHHAWAGQGR
jgi:glycosyltransferase involved in cell wall biosynthesis